MSLLGETTTTIYENETHQVAVVVRPVLLPDEFTPEGQTESFVRVRSKENGPVEAWSLVETPDPIAVSREMSETILAEGKDPSNYVTIGKVTIQRTCADEIMRLRDARRAAEFRPGLNVVKTTDLELVPESDVAETILRSHVSQQVPSEVWIIKGWNGEQYDKIVLELDGVSKFDRGDRGWMVRYKSDSPELSPFAKLFFGHRRPFTVCLMCRIGSCGTVHWEMLEELGDNATVFDPQERCGEFGTCGGGPRLHMPSAVTR